MLGLASQTSAGASNEYNIHKCCMKNLTIFKLEPAAPNRSQLIATHHSRVATWVYHVVPNTICCIEMLLSFGRGFNSVHFDLNFTSHGITNYKSRICLIWSPALFAITVHHKMNIGYN